MGGRVASGNQIVCDSVVVQKSFELRQFEAVVSWIILGSILIFASRVIHPPPAFTETHCIHPLSECSSPTRKSYRTSSRSGYRGMGVQNSQQFRAGDEMLWVSAALATSTCRSFGVHSYGKGVMPFWGPFSLQLGVTMYTPVVCGHWISCCFKLSI